MAKPEVKFPNMLKASAEAWCAWTKEAYGWDREFAMSQAELYRNGVRDVRLHDVTACHFECFERLPH